MSFQSVLQTIGKDIKGVFTFLGSAKGQAIIATGETVAEDLGVPAGLIALANSGLNEIIKLETIATAAGTQNGTGAQKSAAVVSALTPAVLAYAQQNGLATPTAAEIQNAVNGLVAFANALSGSPATTTPAA
jgi:hypothetical protein